MRLLWLMIIVQIIHREVISSLSKNDAKIKGIKLSKNFGQHRAIAAGLHYVEGKWCIIMDCDLQDRPEEIITYIVRQ